MYIDSLKMRFWKILRPPVLPFIINDTLCLTMTLIINILQLLKIKHLKCHVNPVRRLLLSQKINMYSLLAGKSRDSS